MNAKKDLTEIKKQIKEEYLKKGWIIKKDCSSCYIISPSKNKYSLNGNLKEEIFTQFEEELLLSERENVYNLIGLIEEFKGNKKILENLLEGN